MHTGGPHSQTQDSPREDIESLVTSPTEAYTCHPPGGHENTKKIVVYRLNIKFDKLINWPFKTPILFPLLNGARLWQWKIRL